MATCEKCGTTVISFTGAAVCPRCLVADGWESVSTPPEAEFQSANPFFQQSIGDFELLGEVARGGMGVIYRARQKSLGRLVALKVLSSGEFARPEYVARFRLEAAATARLQHPNIVSIHQVGAHEGIPYYTMDLVEGPNLIQWMRGRALAAEKAARLLLTVSKAIQHAHKKGILHRDLKPSNVLIDPQGEPRITDFGLAKELVGGSDLTVTGQVVGTPGYLPPEQADASFGPVTPASDVYSLGALLYYLLTARAPFVAESLSELLRQLLVTDPVAPRVLNPAVPRDLETICLKCLEREPARRYRTAAALAADLTRFLVGDPIIARPLSVPGRLVRWCRRRPARAAAGFLAVILATGSILSTLLIARAWRHTAAALAQVRSAEADGRERLREARLAEARAIRRTTLPGRRERALQAITEAARVRVGDDLREEALAALLLTDVRSVAQWDLRLGVPSDISFDAAGSNVVVRLKESTGMVMGAPRVQNWGGSASGPALELSGYTNTFGPMRYDQEARRVVSRLHGNAVRVWQVQDGRSVLTLTNRPNPGEELFTDPYNDDYGLTPDGKGLVVGLPGGGLSLHRVPDGVELARWSSPEKVTTVRIAPDGRQLAASVLGSAAFRQVEILELPSLRRLRRIPVATRFSGMCWAGDSHTLAIMGSENAIAFHDVISGRLLKNLICPGSGPGELHFLGNDRLLAFRGRGTLLRIVNIGSGVEDLVMDGFGPSQLAAAPGADSFVFSSLTGVATRFHFESPVGCRTLAVPSPDDVEMAVNNCCFDFSADGRWVVSSHGRYLFLRDALSGRVLDSLDTGDAPGLEVSTAAFAPGGRGLLRHSSQTGWCHYELVLDNDGVPHLGAARKLDPTPGWTVTDRTADTRMFFMVDASVGRVRVQEVSENSAKIIHEWSAPGVYAGALNPAGDQALVNCAAVGTNLSGLRIRLHRVRDGAVLRELSAPVSCDVAWSADGRTVMTSNGQDQSTLWEVATWNPKAILQGTLAGDMTSFVIAPESDYAVVTRDETVFLVTLDGRVRARFDIPAATGLAAGIRFLPDRRQFAILWRDGRLDIIDPAALNAQLTVLGLGW